MKVIELWRLPQNTVPLAKWEISVRVPFASKFCEPQKLVYSPFKRIHANFYILSLLRWIWKRSNRSLVVDPLFFGWASWGSSDDSSQPPDIAALPIHSTHQSSLLSWYVLWLETEGLDWIILRTFYLSTYFWAPSIYKTPLDTWWGWMAGAGEGGGRKEGYKEK